MAQADVEKKSTKRSADKRPTDKKTARQANPVVRYLRETRGELRKVTWPSQEESLRLTAIVIGVTIFMMAFLFSFDWLFSTFLEAIVRQLIL